MERDALERLEAVAGDAGADDLALEARELAARATEGRYYVACIGQFKRGKSTLLNALLETDVLPVGVTPVTSVPTVLRFGEPAARVRFGHAWQPARLDRLADYVSEVGNPGNRKGVTGVEVYLPSALLRSGLCLVDTPGLGSVITANTDATRDFLPHIDAAVAVLGAEPPITGDELACIAEVARDAGTLLFVLTKADRTPPTERAEALAFTERALADALRRPVGRILRTSALAGARDPEMARDWSELVAQLSRLREVAGGALVDSAVRRGVGRIGHRVRWLLLERRRALVEPVEAIARRLDELRTLGADADRGMRDLTPLLDAAALKLAQGFETERDRFLAAAGPAALAELRVRLAATAASVGLPRHDALRLANAVAREWIEPWLARAEREGAAAYRHAIGRFTDLAGDLFRRLESVGLDVTGVAIEAMPPAVLDGRRRFCFHDRLRQHEPQAPWRSLAAALLPAKTRRRHRERAAERYLADLLEVNASRVQGDLVDRVIESRRRFETELRRLLAAVSTAGERALAEAAAIRAAGEAAVRTESERIDALLARLDALAAPDADRAA